MSTKQKLEMNRMVSIDLNTPSPSLTEGFQSGLFKNSNLARKLQLTPVNCTETKIYNKYFRIGIAKIASMIQLGLAVGVLISQLCTTGLLIGPINSVSKDSALSTTDRIGLGIWTSIFTTLAVGATCWAVNKTNFFRLHTSMLLNMCSFVGYLVLEYFLLLNTIPRIQERIYVLQQSPVNNTTSLEARRLLLESMSDRDAERDLQIQYQHKLQAELHRLYAALALSIFMALLGIFELLLHLFMSAKTGRAICLGKTYLEGKQLQIETIGKCWKNKSLRVGAKPNSIFELPKLERSDALPPPPYESGYFHPSLIA